MRLGIMQPNFMPYLGYMALVKNVDEFILFDTVQYKRHNWMERNRILKQVDGGWQYISVPLEKHSQKDIIKDIKINNRNAWNEKIYKQLLLYAKAPYYKEVTKLIHRILDAKYDTLLELDKCCLLELCSYIGIKTPIKVYSKLGLDVEKANEPDEWALNICKSMGKIDEYWNLPGGMEFFDRTKYQRANLELKFIDVNITEYKQLKNPIFEERLSIVDVLMFNDVNRTNQMLDDYILR